VKRIVGNAMIAVVGMACLLVVLPVVLLSWPMQWLVEAWQEADS